MSQTGKEILEIRDLSKGMNTFDPETAVPEGYYVDAQNMLLTDKSPTTIGGLTKLTTTAAPDSRSIVWFEPFASPDTGTHSDVAHSDVAHSDVAHGDVAHADVAHGDVSHSDTHSDVAHTDSHSDVAHSDVAHSDVSHSDSNGKSHSDTPHSDVAHTDVAHSDTHSDVAHSDDHSDGHSDSAHSDTAHTDAAHSDTAHTDVAHSDSVSSASFVVALDRGADTDGDGSGIWSYNPNTDTWSHLWTLMHSVSGEGSRYRVTPPYYDSVPFRSRLFFAYSAGDAALDKTPAATTTSLTREDGSGGTSGAGCGSDNPLKHDGRYLMPVGGAGYSFDVLDSGVARNQRVCSMETQAPFSESWTGGTDQTGTGNYKDFIHARSLAGVASMSLDYTAGGGTNRNFTTGLLGAPDFTTTDWFTIWFKPTAVSGTPTFTFRFGDAADANRFDHTTAALTLTVNQWYEYAVRRSAFTTTGSPNWNSIAKFTIFCNTASNTVIFDAGYWQYNNRPSARAAQVEMYNNQLMIADLYDAKTTVLFSNVGSPDYFDPTVGIARFDGGRLTLGEQDRVTALWTYFDELIVGKVSSSWTFSGAGANVSISALPLTIGIAGHAAIAETPWSLHYLYDNNIFGARLTSRGLVSTNINSHLENLDATKGYRTASVRSDQSHTVRWALRTLTATGDQNDLALLYDYQLDAWTARYTPKIRHYTQWINYTTRTRQTLCAQYDGHIRIVDSGTTFDGTAIDSYVTLPWKQTAQPQGQSNVVQWMDLTAFLRGTATVNVDARFADDPHEFDAASFSTYGTIQASPDGDKGYVQFGRTARWMQLRLRATSLAFTVDLPIVIGYNTRTQRV